MHPRSPNRHVTPIGTFTVSQQRAALNKYTSPSPATKPARRGRQFNTFYTSHWPSFFLIVILQPFPPAKAIFAGIAILLAVCLSSFIPNCISPDIYSSLIRQGVKNSRASDTLVELFASFKNFLSRLHVYTGIPHAGLDNFSRALGMFQVG
jgi:hypothetical protein